MEVHALYIVILKSSVINYTLLWHSWQIQMYIYGNSTIYRKKLDPSVHRFEVMRL